MKLNLSQTRLGVVLLHDRLAVAAVSGDRVNAFSIATENPAAAWCGYTASASPPTSCACTVPRCC